jgi:hypothetical protein
MTFMRRTIWIFLLPCLWTEIVRSEPFQSPLFPVDATPLKVTVTAPWRDLVRKRRSRPEFDAIVRYTNAGGEIVSIPATVTTRGNSRLAFCQFPPIRLDFKKKDTKETLFAGQKKLKLVTQCKWSNTYQDYLKAEFKIYRAYNLLTDHSFRVRQLEIEYLDESGSVYRKSDIEFFLEDKRSVKARTGLDTVKTKSLQPDRLNGQAVSRYAMFQYFIGNTDWAVLLGAGDEDCCHNGILLGEKDSDGGWIPVPYDFDQAGLIDARYAKPARGLSIRSVRNRLYRGFCLSNPILDDTIKHFRVIEMELNDLFESAVLSRKASQRATSYVNEFFQIVSDPARVEKEMRAECR